MNRKTFWLLAPVFLALALTLTAWPRPAAAVEEVNSGKGGETLEIDSLVEKGKITVIDFYSPCCPPCLRLAPLLEQLGAKRADLAIKKLNINRANAVGIDWKSPLAQQYSLRSVPHFKIFDRNGRLSAEGSPAMEQVLSWIKEAGLLKE